MNILCDSGKVMIMIVRSPTITASMIAFVLSVGMVALTTHGCGVPREKLIPCNSIEGLCLWVNPELDKVKGHRPLSP